jgi:hypothetical protein
MISEIYFYGNYGVLLLLLLSWHGKQETEEIIIFTLGGVLK